MEVEDVRLRFAAIVNIAYALFRVLAGLLFTVIVARSVAVQDLALYGVALSLASMIGSLVGFWGFWASRAAARGVAEAAPTGFMLTLVYAAVSIPLYVLFSFIEARLLGYGFRVLVFGSILVPALIMAQYATSLSNTLKPQVVGYSGFMYDATRLALVLALVYWLGYGVEGALASMASSYIISGVYMYLLALRRYITASGPRLILAKSWISSFKTPLAQLLYTLLIGGVVALTAPILNDETATAYLSIAAFTYQPILTITRLGSAPLYARSLRSPSARDLAETLKIILFTTIFLSASAIYLSRPVSSIFSPAYVGASPIVASAVVFGSILGLANVYRFYVAGSLPDNGEGRRELTGFLAFQPLALSLFIPAATVASLAQAPGPTAKALGVMAGLLAASVIMLVYNYSKAKAYNALAPPATFIAKAVSASAAPLLLYRLLGASDVIVVDFTEQAPSLAAYILVGFMAYAAILLAIDSWVRRLFSRVISTILARL